MARYHVQAGDLEQAKDLLGQVPAKDKTNADVVAVQASIDLAEKAKEAGPVDDLRAKAAADPKDMQARLDLAMAYWAGNQRQEAIDELLAMIKADRKWNEEAARQQLLKFFEALGFADPLAVDGRKRLSTILFSPDGSRTRHERTARPGRNPFEPAFEQLPETLPIFPLSGVLLLPGGKLPLNIFEPRYLAMVFDALAGHRMIGMVQPQQPGGYAGDGLPTDDGRPKVHTGRLRRPHRRASTRPRTAACCWC